MLSATQNRLAGFLHIARHGARWMLACLAFAAAPALAQDNAAAPLSVTAEAQEGFSRLVFTFTDRLTLPDYQVWDDNGVLVVDFGGPVTTSLPDIAGLLAGDVTIARLDPDGTSVRLGLARPLTRSVREAGEALYVDLLPADWVGLAPALPDEAVARLTRRAEDAAAMEEERRRAQLVAEFNPEVAIHVGDLPTLTRLVFDWNVGTTGSFSATAAGGSVRFDWPVAIDLHPILSAAPDLVRGAVVETDPLGSTIALDVPAGTAMRFYEESPSRFVLDLVAQGAESAEAALDIDGLIALMGSAEDSAGASVPEDAALASPQETGAARAVATAVSQIGHTVRVAFPFPRETAAAVFRRGDMVWMFFETPLPVLAPDRTDLLEGIIADFDVVATGSAQVVRMRLVEDRLATLGTEGDAWVLSLGDLLFTPAQTLTFTPRSGATRLPEITVDLGHGGAVHAAHDPEVGDVLQVVTAFPPARAVVRSLDYVDFEAPASIHGLVVRPRHDGVAVAMEDALAIISASEGLRLSSAVERRLPAALPVQSTMDIAAVHTRSVPVFLRNRDQLLARASQAEGPARDAARLALAIHYIGNDFGPEALGILNVLATDLRTPALEPDVRLARASAMVLAGQYEAAVPLLSDDRLGGLPEAMFWRAIARAETGDFAAARLDALSALDVADAYPGWLRSRFLLAAIRAAIEQRDDISARRLMTGIDVAGLGVEERSRYELLSGRLDELNGYHREALEAYGRVLAADLRTTAPEAVLRTIAILDALGRLDLERAADVLSTQAMVWRGDGLEEETLTTLAGLQFRAGRYREGFSSVRAVSAVAGVGAGLDSLADLARTEFTGLYLDGGADRLDPLEALALFYDFRHLTPVGADGDLMIRNLAQRLVALDLLGQAADLLAYQVESRLEGAGRAQVAADLALVRIANRQPEMALQVLNATRLPNLPPALDRQRRVLEARALIDSRREELALDMLSSMNGRDTDLLRVEALWQARRYRDAAEQIEVLYGGDALDGELDPAARIDVVRAAVGFVLADDRIGLSRLRGKYAGVMSGSPEWQMFAYVTETVSSQSQVFVEIAREIAAADAFAGFLNAYRERYRPIDAIVPSRPVSAG